MLYWPAFEFHYTADMRRLLPHIAAIEAREAVLNGRICPPQWRPHRSAAVDARQNEAIEGACDLDEIDRRKQRLIETNASRAQQWVRERFTPGSAPISLDDILAMHRLIAQESGIRYDTAGRLRTEGLQVVVGDEEIGFHKGAPPSKLQALMEQYTEFLRRAELLQMPAIIHALIAHFFFTTIHPFEDGNGRVSRLVSAAILFQRGYHGHGSYALTNYFYENAKRYHALVYRTQRDPVFDLTEFLAFGMEGLAVELDGINNFVRFKMTRHSRREPRPDRILAYF